MRKLKYVLLFVLAAVLSFGVVACDNGNENTDNVLRIYLWNETGATPEGFQEVVDYFNTTYGPELGFTVNFRFDTQSDYKQNLNLSMSASGTDYDLVFDAGWIYLNDFARNGYYYDLYDYFTDAEKYPGLAAAFDTEYLDSNLFSGGLYGIPLTETYGDVSVAYIRKDWREECAADTTWQMPSGKFDGDTPVSYSDLEDGIDSFDELQYYLYWIEDNKPGVVPCLSNNTATWGAWDIINSRNQPAHSAQDYVNAGVKQNITITTNVTATAYIYRDEVVAAYINDVEDPNSTDGMSSFPAGFNAEGTEWQDSYTIAKRWADDGIIDADVLQETGSDARFRAGEGGCVLQTINNFSAVESSLQASTPGAELEIYVADYASRNKLNGYAQTDFKAWNFLCVPVAVGDAKRDMVLEFMNWIFSSRENHDLFQYGIRGTHWDVAKDAEGNEIEGTVTRNGYEAYAFNAYLLTWNPNFIRVNNASDPKVIEYMEYMYDPDRYVGILYSEFTFDSTANDALTTALSNADISNAHDQAIPYYLGQVDDPITNWNALKQRFYNNTSMQSAVSTIKNEVMTQLQNYIDSLA